MDLFDGLKGALRRWYVLLPVLIVTAIVAIVINGRKTTQYTSTALIGVTTGSTSVQSAVPSGAPTISRNNALVTNGGVTLVANLLSIGLAKPSVVTQVVAAGGTPDFSVSVVQRGPSAIQLPIVTLSATGSSSAQVAATMRVLTSAANTTLADLQRSAGVPSDKYAKSFVINPASTPARNVLSRARNVGVVIVVGVIVALVLAAVLDNVLLRRRARRRATAGQPMSGVDQALDVRAGA